jgi:hypothetical protein
MLSAGDTVLTTGASLAHLPPVLWTVLTVLAMAVPVRALAFITAQARIAQHRLG